MQWGVTFWSLSLCLSLSPSVSLGGGRSPRRSPFSLRKPLLPAGPRLARRAREPGVHVVPQAQPQAVLLLEHLRPGTPARQGEGEGRGGGQKKTSNQHSKYKNQHYRHSDSNSKKYIPQMQCNCATQLIAHGGQGLYTWRYGKLKNGSGLWLKGGYR